MSILKLKIQLLFNRLIILIRNNALFLSIGIIILIFTIIKWYFIFLLLFYLFYIYKKNKELFILLIIIISFFLISYTFTTIYISNFNQIKGIVTSIEYKEDYNKVTISYFFKKFIIYDSDKLDIKISDKLEVTGRIKDIYPNKNEFSFNEEEYLKGIRAIIIYPDDIKIIKSINIYTIRKLLYQYLDKYYYDKLDVSNFIKALILGDTHALSESDTEAIRVNNISHLFAISGLHIGLIVSFISKLLNKTKLKTKTQERIINIFLIFYIYISNFSPSVIRASLLYIFGVYNKNHNLNLKSIDILSIIFIILVLINPFYLYNLSFKLSFFASLIIILSQSLLQLIKSRYQINMITELILITLILQLISLGVTVNISNSINITSIITNSIFIVYVSYILLPGAFISFFIFPFKYVYIYLVKIFLFGNDFISDYLKLVIDLPSMEKYEIFIFYLLLVLIFKYLFKTKIYKNKYIYLFILFFLCYYNKSYLNVFGKVSFLDMYEGDATVINYSFNGGVVIIDTGDGKNEALKEYLIKKGIRKVDALILTHNHTDHNGEARSIINYFNIKNVYTSIYDDSNISSIKLKSGDTININNHLYYFISPDNYSSDVNENSLVFYTKLGNYNYLFLADATKSIENEIISKIKEDIDVIKVAHHGSNTSTSQELINTLSLKISIIMVGDSRSKYFPSKDVIERLRKTKIYRTDKNYQINIYFTKFYSKVKCLNN